MIYVYHKEKNALHVNYSVPMSQEHRLQAAQSPSRIPMTPPVCPLRVSARLLMTHIHGAICVFAFAPGRSPCVRLTGQKRLSDGVRESETHSTSSGTGVESDLVSRPTG